MATLSEIAAHITEHAKLLDEHLQSKNLPPPSFAIDAPPDFPNPEKDPRVEAARVALIEDTQTLRNLALGPAHVVREVGWSLLLRQSSTIGLFHEPSPNHIAHTASSALLFKDKALNDWFGHHLEEVFPAGVELADVVAGGEGIGMGKGKSAFRVAFGVKESFWEFLEMNPERQRRFLGAMKAVGGDGDGGHDLGHVVGGWDWGGLPEGAVVVDVGGSSGPLSIALAQSTIHTNPNLTFMVQDYAHTIDSGRADVYVLRHVCHNWSDGHAARILGGIVPVMKRSSRILLVEVVVVEPGVVGRVQERYMRNVDVTMFQMLGTQERSREDWERVVGIVDGGNGKGKLGIKGVSKPEGSWDSIIEVGFV
ncbi:S-adenosyl-L-methionine-dependent methyltransferase [Aspergillus sclerotioniger CBS 115572]|uniref:S-adenosyl-L-methionine-dependent methyltransferase n=1 Tax=Aspergillus sclerotioniger CBS 115572 TaxID=1450535 RepID=A0A317V143_9EURO|nr:S-adenosyl-L-methionine-dependent methyltransferase [Aspergillus sclerotioniger CBS 115572]PWY67993.1 S-adenosyl-L-methionine-dependent methyltransferase [Aspergillus sclerotioniger CBS 115572]